MSAPSGPTPKEQSSADGDRRSAEVASGAEPGEVVMVSTEGVARTRKSRDVNAPLEPLFAATAAADFRSRWDEVQRGFVDDPQRAVKAGDELVTEVIDSLADSFGSQRELLSKDSSDGERSTENLRVALRRYRSFFERLLAV